MSKTDNIFVVYNVPGASDFHADIVKAIRATGTLPEELTDVLTLTMRMIDGAPRWFVDAA